jgi:ABC-2 type transport system permease protein
MGSRDVSALGGALRAVNQAIATRVAEQAAPEVPVQMLQQPVKITEHVVVGGRQAATPVNAVMSFVSQQTTFIPIVLFIVIIFAAQMIATAIATEKENKTLETLLSYPISRGSLVTAKMVAAGLVALVSAGVYMFGMRSYMNGIESGLGGTGAGARAAAASEAIMQRLGLTFSAGDYALLGLTMFAGILVALSIAIILGGFAESVKAVQALLTPLMVLLLVPYFLTLFIDIDQLPTIVRWVVMAIPFTYPFIAGPNLFLGNYSAVWFGIVYQLIWFTVFVVIAARIFSSDRILTMKLDFSRKRRRSRAAERSSA